MVVLEAQGIRQVWDQGVLMDNEKPKPVQQEVFQDKKVSIDPTQAKANEEWKRRDMPWSYGPP